MSNNTRSLVEQMREALNWCVTEINRCSPSSVNAGCAIDAADAWLASQPTKHNSLLDLGGMLHTGAPAVPVEAMSSSDPIDGTATR